MRDTGESWFENRVLGAQPLGSDSWIQIQALLLSTYLTFSESFNLMSLSLMDNLHFLLGGSSAFNKHVYSG